MNTAYAVELVQQMAKRGEPGSDERNLELYPLVVAGDKAARAEMIESNMSLVIAKVDYYLRSFPQAAHIRDDLVSEGFVGLCTAVNKMAESPAIQNPNPTGYMSYWINGSIGAMVDKETAIGACGRTLRNMRRDGVTLPQQVVQQVGTCVLDQMMFEQTADPVSMIELRDLLEACCESDEDREIIRLRELGLSDREIASALEIPYSTTYMMRRELYRRFLEKSGMPGEV